MDELELSKIVGVGCAAMLAFVGLSEVSKGVVAMDSLEKPAYSLEIDEAEGSGDAEVEVVSVATLMADADAAKGKKVFGKCAGCHNAADGKGAKTGPNLWGIMGRDIASVDGFGYSAVLTEKEGNWDWDAMNAFLTKPAAYAKGTKMKYGGLKKDADRANLMAWLNEQSGAPIDLPSE